ncbi:bifunctional hydroxymethylpyrimidine kinase/phosphomethylpyrimidine kinase [Pedobacter sp. PWIIR3]
MKRYTYPSVLTIAGFDGSGGAGIQAEIKTISALGCYATSVLTALPVQNTTGVKAVYPIPVLAVKEQMEAIFEDIYPDAIKMGMVHTEDLVTVIAAILSTHAHVPVVFDPVMVSSSGHRLLEEQTICAIVEKLFPIAHLITPNLDEAAVLAEMEITTVAHMYLAGEKILKLGARGVLLKGGHLKSAQLTTLYFSEAGDVFEFHSSKIETNNTHGTGCTLSSAIASYLSRGETMLDAVKLGQDYVQQAIISGQDVIVGKGKGSLNHFFDPKQLIKINEG